MSCIYFVGTNSLNKALFEGLLLHIGDCKARTGNANDEIEDNFSKYSNDLRNEDYIVDGTLKRKRTCCDKYSSKWPYIRRLTRSILMFQIHNV